MTKLRETNVKTAEDSTAILGKLGSGMGFTIKLSQLHNLCNQSSIVVDPERERTLNTFKRYERD